jgi:hypothetical protein
MHAKSTSEDIKRRQGFFKTTPDDMKTLELFFCQLLKKKPISFAMTGVFGARS